MSHRWKIEQLAPVHQGESLRLGLRNLYILPTSFGWLWLGAGTLLVLVAIQTQQNGPLLLGYLLLGLMLLTLFLTQFNLQGLEIRCSSAAPGFAGSPCAYTFILWSDQHRDGLHLNWQECNDELDTTLVVHPGEQSLTLTWVPTTRGWQKPGNVRICSSAPLGLFHCWSRWRPKRQQLIYPYRRPGPVQSLPSESPGPRSAVQVDRAAIGTEEWHDLGPHRVEDGANRLAWKQVAQGRGRLSKRFGDTIGTPLVVGPASGLPMELAIEHLSERIWQLGNAQARFGLELPGLSIATGEGLAHRDRCLQALATWR